MKLRLFAVRHGTTRQLQPGFFSDKKAAHAERDRLNKEADSPTAYCVTRGPDHRLYHGKH